MAGKLSARFRFGFGFGKRPAARTLAVPAEAGWELWSFPDQGAAPPAMLPLESPSRAPSGTRVLLPARQVTTVPLWLQSTDAALFPGLLAAQLERRGIDPALLAAATHAEVAREEQRTLVTAFLINPALPAELLLPEAEAYELSARARPLPPDALTLWREQGGIAAAATRGAQLAHLQFFPLCRRLDEIADALAALAARLAWEKIVAGNVRVVLWGDFAEADAARGRFLFPGSPVAQAPLPPLPPPPGAVSATFLPAPVRDARAGRARTRDRRRLFLGAAGAYAALALAVAGAFGWELWQERALAGQLAAVKPEAEQLSATAARWRALQPAVDPAWYPMECLLAAVQGLPAEVRLTQFEHSPAKVRLTGEGRDAASIFKFLQAVEAHPFLKQWRWTMPQPALLPNNRAQFQIEGAREPAPSN